METDRVSELIHWRSSASSVTINPTLQQHFNLRQVITICNHVLYQKEPTITRLQRQLGMWNSYIKHPWRGREYHPAQFGYLHEGERREAAYSSLNIWQEKQLINARLSWTGCQLCFHLEQDQACTKMQPDSVFGVPPARSSWQWETKRSVCVCVCITVWVHVQKKQLLCLEKD